jgi:CheY-like chemotaxis protein
MLTHTQPIIAAERTSLAPASRHLLIVDDQVVATEPVDVILTDYVMPGMDGLTLAQALRALGFTGPIVLLTGLADLQAAARAAGVTQVIEKPVRLSVLDDLITRLLVG